MARITWPFCRLLEKFIFSPESINQGARKLTASRSRGSRPQHEHEHEHEQVEQG